jgi:hypothetical protein
MYKGEWKDGLKHGPGTYTFPDGAMDVGEFRKDKQWNVTGFDNSGNISVKWVKGRKQK